MATPDQRMRQRSNAATKPLPPTLRDLRNESGLSLTEAAERMGINKARLSELERGWRGPSYDELHAAGRLYGRLLCVRLAIVVAEGAS